MRLLIFSTVVLFLFSCGRKRVITERGTILLNNKNLRWEIFTERDTCFKYFYENERVVAIAASVDSSDLHDSTFYEKDFAADGKVIQLKSFRFGKPDGEWTSFYPNGKKKSVSLTRNGTLVSYRAWYDNGQAQVNGMRQDNGKMQRNEFFKNGTKSQEFEMDSLGAGYCTSYFMNGKKREEGNLYNFSPIGIWKRYDSLGNKRGDTLLGVSVPVSK